jgi:hypothetical protein
VGELLVRTHPHSFIDFPFFFPYIELLSALSGVYIRCNAAGQPLVSFLGVFILYITSRREKLYTVHIAKSVSVCVVDGGEGEREGGEAEAKVGDVCVMPEQCSRCSDSSIILARHWTRATANGAPLSFLFSHTFRSLSLSIRYIALFFFPFFLFFSFFYIYYYYYYYYYYL